MNCGAVVTVLIQDQSGSGKDSLFLLLTIFFCLDLLGVLDRHQTGLPGHLQDFRNFTEIHENLTEIIAVRLISHECHIISAFYCQ